MFKIAIIGRPNVGKSTLFNKLVGRSIAITDDTPGVTRDRKESKGALGPLRFIVIDTAGLENQITSESLEKRMVEQTQAAVADADMCLFVVDSKAGPVNEDFYFSQWLRKLDKKTVLIANKCENFKEEVFGREYYKLGFGAPIAISAEHKLGFGELYDAIEPEIVKYEESLGDLKIVDEEKFDEEKRLQIAIIGRPNAGKSTFLNKILDEDRLITGPEAGITRDAIAIDHEFKGKIIRFIDTAGIRKKANITKKLEKLSTIDSFRAVRFAQIVILLIDANSLLDHQDMALAGEVIREGRGLVFAINKIDSVKGDKEVFMKQVREQLQNLFPEISGAAIIGVSAKGGYNVEKAVQFALDTYEQWQTYIPTTKLMEWLKYAEMTHPPKLHKGKAIKLKYATQIKKRPPTIAVFTNHIKPLEGSYKRYLVNSLRKHFELDLTPVRMVLRKSDNPFEGTKEKVFSKKLHKPKK
jgi:GTP-binding protein